MSTGEQVAKLAELKIPFVSTQRFLTATNDVAADKGSPLDRELVRAVTPLTRRERRSPWRRRGW